MTHFISRLIANPRHTFIGAIATLAIATTALTPAFAGDKHKLDHMSEQEQLEHMENRLDKRMEHLTKELTLSSEQAIQVRGILSAAQTARHDIRDRYKDDRKAAKPELQAVKAQSKEDLKRVLTSDQYSKLESLHAEKRARKGGRHHGEKGDRAAKHMERLDRELDLSDAQVTQIKALHAERHLRAKAIIKEAGSREAAKPQLRELRKQSREDVRALLDASQQQKFDAMKKERGHKRKHQEEK